MKLDLFVYIVPNNHLCHIKSDDYIQIEDFQLELEKIINAKYNSYYNFSYPEIKVLSPFQIVIPQDYPVDVFLLNISNSQNIN